MNYITDEIKMLTQLFNRQGYELYLVGGCVRDMIMNLPPSDFDMATSALPMQTKEVLKDFRTIDTGLQHGTVTAIVTDAPYEITTYRIDCGYSDGRHPDKVDFTGKLLDDMARRDFTMNAMAMDSEGNVIDYYGGVDDIAGKLIRAVGNPDRRFSEDALRILRALRFSARLGFDIEEETAAALVRNQKLLDNISAERIFSEISKTLTCENAPQIVSQFGNVISWALLGIDFDEKDAFERFANFLKEIYLHESGAAVRFAGMFKILGVEKPEVVLKRLKVSNVFFREVMGVLSCCEGFSELNIARSYDEEALERKIRLKLIDYPAEYVRSGLLLSAFCDEGEISENAVALAQSVLTIREAGCFDMKSLAICGNDLKAMGISGREIGNCLNKALRAVALGDLKNEKPVLAEFIRENI